MNTPEVNRLNKETYGPFFQKLVDDRETVAAVEAELKFFDSLTKSSVKNPI
jgi:hypothetical protein